MNSPLFSIIVPVYNVEQYLTECINSVTDQQFDSCEIILVDDGSTDRSGRMCDELAMQNSKIRVIHQTNAGLSAARNIGVANALGKYLIFLDGDDFLAPGSLQVIARNLDDAPEVLRFQVQDVYDDGRIVPHHEVAFETMSGIGAFPYLASSFYTENAWAYVYETAFFHAHKFAYAEGYLAEDFGLTPLIIATANKVKGISEICYCYRQRSGSITHDEAKVEKRIDDAFAQLKVIVPEIAKIPGTQSILHFVVISLLSSATQLLYENFRDLYDKVSEAGFMQYIHPENAKAWPRSLLVKHFPALFYRVYRRKA